MSDTKPTLAELRERAAARAAKAQEDAEAREARCLELEEKYAAELGAPGVGFAVVSTLEGPVVVKPGPVVLFKQLRDGAPEITFDAMQTFVQGCLVFPDRKEFAAMVERRAGIVTMVGDALLLLYRGAENLTRGK